MPASTSEPAPPPGRRELNKIQTRQRLIRAASELMGESSDSATVEEIAERAQVSRATFFNYFPSKDELLHAIYLSQLGLLTDLVTQLLARELTTRQRIEGVYEDLARLALARPTFVVSYVRELDRLATSWQMNERSTALAAQLGRILAAGLEVGEVRTDVSVDFLAEMLCANYLSTLRYGSADMEVERFADYFRRAGAFAATTTLPLAQGTNAPS